MDRPGQGRAGGDELTFYMATVMRRGNSEGEQGRCGDRCHMAEKPECACMCGGLYHGSKRGGTFEQINEGQGRELIDRLVGEGKIHSAQGLFL